MASTPPPLPTADSDLKETEAYLDYLRTSKTTISIRTLIGFWGHKGRGKNNIGVISGDLARMRLRVDPPFDSGPLDTQVSLSRAAEDVTVQAEAERPADHLLTLARIDSAGFALRPATEENVHGIVARDAPIADAVTFMMRHDFSQLPVVESLETRTVIGVLTWEGYAQARLRGADPTTVEDCLVSAPLVDLHSDLLASIEPVTTNGFVVVTWRGVLSGIVTAADITGQFGKLALPFLAVGRCERELKRVAKTLLAVPVGKMKKQLDDLSFGNVQDIYDQHWSLLGWSISKTDFVGWLDATRRLRNSIAHFDDEQDARFEKEIPAVHRLARWLSAIPTPDEERPKREGAASS